MKSTRKAKEPVLNQKNQYSSGLSRTAISLIWQDDTMEPDEQALGRGGG
jgi:hypothetical protein